MATSQRQKATVQRLQRTDGEPERLQGYYGSGGSYGVGGGFDAAGAGSEQGSAAQVRDAVPGIDAASAGGAEPIPDLHTRESELNDQTLRAQRQAGAERKAPKRRRREPRK